MFLWFCPLSSVNLFSWIMKTLDLSVDVCINKLCWTAARDNVLCSWIAKSQSRLHNSSFCFQYLYANHFRSTQWWLILHQKADVNDKMQSIWLLIIVQIGRSCKNEAFKPHSLNVEIQGCYHDYEQLFDYVWLMSDSGRGEEISFRGDWCLYRLASEKGWKDLKEHSFSPERLMWRTFLSL